MPEINKGPIREIVERWHQVWRVDLYHDYEWVEKYGTAMECKVELNLDIQSNPNLSCKIQLFGSGNEVHHAAILLDRDISKESVEEFINGYIHRIFQRIEFAITIVDNRTFRFRKHINGNPFYTYYETDSSGQYKSINVQELFRLDLDYNMIGKMMATQTSDMYSYIFFYSRGIDANLDIDYRWVNLYKMFELRFGTSSLPKSDEWRGFLNNFKEELDPFMIGNRKTLYGLMEELRASAYHAISSKDVVNFGNPNNRERELILVETLPIVVSMANKIMNELPGNEGLRFGKAASGEDVTQ